MTLNIEINDAKVANFTSQAKDEIKIQIDDISSKLIEEALRIERSERLKGDKQEVTSSVVQKAAELFFLRYSRVKSRKRKVLIEIASLLLMSLSSILFTIAFSDLQNKLTVLCFAITFLTIGIVFSVISIMNKYE